MLVAIGLIVLEVLVFLIVIQLVTMWRDIVDKMFHD